MLQTLAKRFPEAPLWIVDEEGRVKVRQLGRLADPSATQAATKRPLIAEIEDCTVLLPPFVGGLSTNGTLDGESTVANNVADIDEPVNEPASAYGQTK